MKKQNKRYCRPKEGTLIKRGDEFLDSFSGKWKKTTFCNLDERVGWDEKYRRIIKRVKKEK